MIRTKRNIVLTVLLSLIISLALMEFGLSESKKANADGVTTVGIDSVSFLGFENNNTAIALYRVSLSDTLPGSANTTNVSPRTLAVQSNSAVCADVRGENTNNSIIVRMLYGLVKSGASSISDLDDGTVVTLKSGISFGLSCGDVQFATDWEATYHTGDSVLTFSTQAVSLSISSVSFVGNESAAIGLYRINLASAMSSSANTTFAIPNTVVQKQDGNSAADIRGEGTANSLIVRVPYGRVKSGATSISDLDDGTLITIKAGVKFTLNNGVFEFDEDFVLEYTAGASSFVKKVDVVAISISSVSFLGNESAAVGLYRINLASAMSSSANTTFATPNTVVQKQDGNSAADIRGEGTADSLIVRVPYGRVKSGATAIGDLDDGTLITIKAGVKFTLDNGVFEFDEDFVLKYTAGASSFVKKVDVVAISISSVSFLGNESAAVGLYRINLASAMSSSANTTFATPNTVVQKQDGNSAADIRGEGTADSLIVRVPYGRVQTGAASIDDLVDGTKITIKSEIPFTLDNGTFSFTEDHELVYYQGAESFVPYVEPVELSISELTYLGIDSNPAIGLYRITLSSDMDTAAGITFATPNTVVQKQDGNSAADIRGEGATNSLIVRIPYGRVKSGAASVADLDEGTTLIIKGNKMFTLDNGAFFFDKDTTIVLYKTDNDFHIQKEHLSDKQVSVVKTEFLRVSDNPLAFDYNLYLSDSIICEEQLVTCKNRYENTRAILVNSNNEFVGYVFSTLESDCLMARIYVSTISTSGEIDDIEDALLLKIVKDEQYTFDSKNFFEFDKDIEFCFNKADGVFCVVTKDNDGKYIVYDNDLEKWVKLQPNFEVKINGKTVDDDVVYVPCGKNKNILSIKAYDASNSDMEVNVNIPNGLFDVDDNFVYGDYSITVNATDNMGVFSEKTYTLKVVDGVEPTISLVSVKQEYSQGEQLEFEASVTDNIDDLNKDDIKVLYPDGAINENGLLPGNWNIQLYAEDSNHNIGYSEVFSILVHDTVAPEITITGVTEYEAGLTYQENSTLGLNVSIIDNVDGEITNYEVVIPEGFVVNEKIQAGVWTITIRAYDSETNKGTASIEITVVDTQAPEITINANNKVSYYENDVPSFSVAAMDSAEGEIDVEYIYPENCLDGDGKLTVGNGTWTITAKAVDKSGNESTKSFNIFVEPKDTTAPVITITGERDYAEGDKLNLIVLANDDVDGNISVDVVKPDGMEDSEGKLNQGTWIIKYSAIDGAGNTAVENITIVVAGTNDEEKESGGCLSNISCNWFIILAIPAIFIVMAKRKKDE